MPTQRPVPVAARRARALLPCLTLLAGLAAAVPAVATPSVPSASAMPTAVATQGRPDQVYVRHERTGDVRVYNGTITRDGIDKVVIARGGDESRFDAPQVEDVVWGRTTDAFAEGRTFREREDWENAAARFLVAAGDEEERDVVRAAARLAAASALMNWGADDASHYAEAAEQFERFLADHSGNRQVPLARSLQARTAWLAGDPARAGSLYRSLFEEGTGSAPTPGYDLGLCLEAGLHAARALTDAGDTLAAREIYGVLNDRARTAAAQAEEDTPERRRFARLEAEGALGDGFVDVASGQFDQALVFFGGQYTTAQASGDAARLYGATFGRALAQLGKGETRKAQLAFATVSALDFTDRDRSAAAKVGLARCYRELGDPGAGPKAEALLTEVVEHYGTTPSAREARAELE